MKTGVTLLEVLIAILVASVGLLGAIAVFPVALAQAKKGQTADITAVAGESAIADFSARGMHNPQSWRYWNGQVALVPSDFQETNHPDLFGRAFCIDPAGFAHNRDEDAANGTDNSTIWSHFPAVPQGAAQVSGRMPRITLHSGNPSIPAEAMSYLQADKAFRIEDELMYERPDDNTLPAAQLFTPVDDGQGGLSPGRRQEEGRLSWFATLVPRNVVGTHPKYFDLDSDGVAEVYPIPAMYDDYTLSIVVCRERTGEALHVPGSGDATEQHPWGEWTAKILDTDFHSSGVGGGEVTITTNDASQDGTFADPKYLELRSGQWIMLGKTVPAPWIPRPLPPGYSNAGPIQVFSWYRISSVDEEPRQAGARWQVDATLIGPDWVVDGECDVVIVPSVAHVWERTIRLDH